MINSERAPQDEVGMALLKAYLTPDHFTRSINSIAPDGARTLPSWIT